MTSLPKRGAWVRRSRTDIVEHMALFLMTGSHYILSLRECRLYNVRWCMTSNPTRGANKNNTKTPRMNLVIM